VPVGFASVPGLWDIRVNPEAALTQPGGWAILAGLDWILFFTAKPPAPTQSPDDHRHESFRESGRCYP
jgi:hypothetical protein